MISLNLDSDKQEIYKEIILFIYNLMYCPNNKNLFSQYLRHF